MKPIHQFALTAVFASVASVSWAQAGSFPERPGHLIVPYPAGGPYDIMGRNIAGQVGKNWGNTSMVVENKVGANGAIASQFVARSAPDGYTIMVSDSTTMSLNPSLSSKLPYDPEKDFVQVRGMYQSSCVLTVAPKLNVKTLAEFVKLAKAQPGKLNYGSFGVASFLHLHQEELNRLLGIELYHVPYKGSAEVVQAILTGDTQLDKRLPTLPDVPTFKELGVPFTCYNWVGIAAPANTSKPVVDKLAADIGAAIGTEDFQQKNFYKAGLELIDLSPEKFAEYVRNDRRKYQAYVKQVNIKIE